MQPAEFADVFAGGGLVRLLLQPPHHRIVPRVPRLVAQVANAPQLTLESIVRFLR
jgi:hypothetical protein